MVFEPELINQTLQVNLTHQDPVVPQTGGDIAVPNTGFIGEVINNLGVVGCSLVLIALGAFILGLVVLLLRSKFRQKIARRIPRISFITGVSLLLLALGFSVPASISTVQAVDVAANTVTLNLAIPFDQNSAVGTADTSITLKQDYHDGYIVFAHTEEDNKLHHTNLWDTVFSPTQPASSLEKLSMNSYGMKNEQENYVALSTDAMRPTKLVDNADDTLAGTTVPMTYGVKADNTMPLGLYRSLDSSIHFEIVPDVYYLNYEDYASEGHIVESKHNATFTLDAAPTKVGYHFKEYNTAPDGSGKSYHPGDTYTADYVSATIYTIWETNTYNLTYDVNQGAGGPGTVTQYGNPVFAVTENPPTRTGYTLKGWADTPDATEAKYKIGDTITLEEPTTGTGFTTNKTVYAVWGENTYNLTFNTNKGIGTPVPQTQKHNPTFAMPKPYPTRATYIFKGWARTADAKTPDVGPDGEFKMDDPSDGSFVSDQTLYAVWEAIPCNPSATTIDKAVCMQEMNADVHNSMIQDKQYQLRDERDGNVYYIAKLKDQNVWMTQNLDFDLTQGKILTPDDTNINENWDPASTTLSKDNLGAWQIKSTEPRSYDPGEEYIMTSGGTGEDSVYNSLTACAASGHSEAECQHYLTGNIYNWTAAKATNDSSSQKDYSTSSQDSICPKGWTLPNATSDGASQFGSMLFAYDITHGEVYEDHGYERLREEPIYWVTAGQLYRYSGSIQRMTVGRKGAYHSNAASSFSHDTSRTYSAHFDNQRVKARDEQGARDYGLSVRCVVALRNFMVHYDANGGEDAPETQTYGPTNDRNHTFKLTEGKIPKRNNYTFGGWTTVKDNQAGAYSPGSEIYITSDNPEVTLYAIWIPNSEIGFNNSGITTMQAMTNTICANAPEGTTGRLQDARDYKIYHVTKLKDGRCWMSQNLSLDINADKTYTSADTNLVDRTEWKPKESASKYQNTIPYNKLDSSTWYGSSKYPYSYNSADSYFQPKTPLSANSEVETKSGDAHYATGNYYNWTAAKATNDSSAQQSYDSSSKDSICPKGWTLPFAKPNDTSDFGKMLYAQNIIVEATTGIRAEYATGGFDKIRTAPVYWMRAGYLSDATAKLMNGGIEGRYWSTSASSVSYAYDTHFKSNEILQRYDDSRGTGHVVRCLTISHTYNLKFDANGGGDAPDTQVQENNPTFTIPDQVPTRFGYTFKGWATTAGATEKEYDPGSTISLDEPATGTISEKTLYAVWELIPCNPSATTIDEAVCMQDINQDVRKTMSKEQQYRLRDNRDNKIYYLSKLKDGKVWMTQNLDLNLDSNKLLTPDDSDVSANWQPQTTYTATSEWTSTDSTNLNSIDLGDYYYDGKTNAEATTGTSYADFAGFSTTGDQHYHAGNLYSYNAVTANSGRNTEPGKEAPDSICPKGWHLPTGGTNGEFTTLKEKYVDTTSGYPVVQDVIDGPLYMVRGGKVEVGQLHSAAHLGSYWSSTASSDVSETAIPNTLARSLVFSGINALTSSANSLRYSGFSVRCISNITYNLKYDANGGSDAPATQTQEDMGLFTISSDQPTREGYTFQGWAETPDATEVDPSLAPGKQIVLSEPTSGHVSEKTLYAVWTAECNPAATNIAEAVCMQDINEAVRYSMEPEQQYQLRDKRDQKQYYVAKLRDNNIWMTQNLDLELSDGTPLTSELSDISAGRSWTPQTTLLQSQVGSWPGSGSDNVTSIDMGNYYYDPAKQDAEHTGTSYGDFVGFSGEGDQHYHVGNIYSYNAAVAGSGAGVVSQEAPDSICPKGWKLPKGSAAAPNDFSTMLEAYGAWEGGATGTVSILLQEPIYMVRGGRIYSGLLRNAGDYGYYWSSTAQSTSSRAFFLNFSKDTDVHPIGDNSRYYGLAVRCLAMPNTYNLKYDGNHESATDVPEAQTQTDNGTFTIPEAEPLRDEYLFLGWAETPDATKAQYQPGDKITLNAPTSGTTTEKTLYAVWGKITYKLHYDANGEGVSRMPETQVSISGTKDYTFQLTDLNDDTIPVREGYTFGGWTAVKASGATYATNQAAAYSPGSDLYLKKENPEKTIYAIWIPNSEMGFGSLTGNNAKMQNMTTEVCNAIPIADTKVTGRLQDSRDYKVYYVTKEADGKCWMTQNLSLDIRKDKTYTAADTNITDGTEWKPGESKSLYKSTIPAGHLGGATWGNAYYYPESYNPADSYYAYTSSNWDSWSSTGNAHYTVGNYYNWNAAVASNDTSSHKTTYENMPNSICPKGWRLPKTDAFNETSPYSDYSWLFINADVSTLAAPSTYTSGGRRKAQTNPLWLVRSGYLASSSIGFAGNYGDYENATVYGATQTLYSTINQGYPDPIRINTARYNGESIRCVAESYTYKLNYDANGGEGAPATQTQFSKTNFTISSKTPTREGYEFKGWAETADATEADPDLDPGKTINLPEPTTGTTSEKTLFAVWEDATPTMQNFTCSSLASGASKQLKDARDGKMYWVAKLADGNCWMTQNLDLNLDSSTPLTSELSDVTSSWTPQTTLSQSEISSWTGSDHDVVRSIDMGDFYYDGSTHKSQSASTSYANFEGFLTPDNPNIDQHYHVGNLYSWNAATANSRASSAGAGEATDSICPKGWRLPTGGSSGEFKSLVDAYGAGSTVQTLINEPLYMVRGGYVYFGQLWGAAYGGDYWSSTAYSSNYGYELVFSDISYVGPSGKVYRYNGQSLRCVAR